MAQITAPPDERDPGELIREKRKALGQTQIALAERARLSQPYVSQLELGERELTESAAVKLERALQLPPYTLVNLVSEDRGSSEDSGAFIVRPLLAAA